MAFTKAVAGQAALKMGIYGPAGSGKTLTALLIAEGLASASGKRVAFVDTERGTDFYAMAVPQRRVHPEAFDFDANYTRSIADVTKDVRALDPREHGVVVIDSITHIWKAAIAAYNGKKTKRGGIPFPAWGRIKAPYEALMQTLLNSPMHVIICGRQGVIYDTNTDTDEIQAVGVRMKAEGETPYEMHVLGNMVPERHSDGSTSIAIYFEKDRTSVLAGQTVTLYTPDGKMSPTATFDLIARPLIKLLGGTQAQTAGSEETAAHDQEELAAAERERLKQSAALRDTYEEKIAACTSLEEVDALAQGLAPLRSQMHSEDVVALRVAFKAMRARFKNGTVREREPGEDDEHSIALS